MKTLLARLLFGGLLLNGIPCARNCPLDKANQSRALPQTGITFKTADVALQRLFDRAKPKSPSNMV